MRCPYHPHAELISSRVQVPKFALLDAERIERTQFRCSVPGCPRIFFAEDDQSRRCNYCGGPITHVYGDMRCGKCIAKRAKERGGKMSKTFEGRVLDALRRLAGSSWGKQGIGGCASKTIRRELIARGFARYVAGESSRILALTLSGFRELYARENQCRWQKLIGASRRKEN